MSALANERFQMVVAPDGLVLVQELLNTRHTTQPALPDLLGSLETAQPWAVAAIDAWAKSRASSAPDIELTSRDLSKLKKTRDALRQTLVKLRDGDEKAHPASIMGTVSLTLDETGVVVSDAKPAPGDWITSTILSEILVAQAAGKWPRMKICANPSCQYAFWDRTRNLSGVWHDVHMCGNAINLRKSRARRKTEREVASRLE